MRACTGRLELFALYLHKRSCVNVQPSHTQL